MSGQGQDRWAMLLRGPEESIPLDEACLAISARLQADAAVDVDVQLHRLDELAAQVPVPSTDGVVGHLFRSGSFQGNVDDYRDPANSYLDRVLDRHVGIPISLAILAVSVGRRIGVPLHGVGMPGHFLLGSRSEPGRFVDVFSGGIDLDVGACRRLFQAGFGPDRPFDLAWLEPVGTIAVLTRVLANLKNSFAALGALRPLADALILRAEIPGVPVSEQLELAEVFTALGRFPDAAARYDHVADVLSAGGEDPEGGRVRALRSRAIAARARLN